MEAVTRAMHNNTTHRPGLADERGTILLRVKPRVFRYCRLAQREVGASRRAGKGGIDGFTTLSEPGYYPTPEATLRLATCRPN